MKPRARSTLLPLLVTAVASAVPLALDARASAPREALGVHGSWGAFRDIAPARCFAIAEPARPIAGERGLTPYASIGYWPGARVHGQLHLRLRRLKLPNAAITLTIGDARYRLVGGGADAWAPDWRVDTAIVAAMRSGTSMSIETRARDGHGFAEVYALHGAATAIDAAALACR